MAGGLKPIRRVVTGNDERGRSKVVWDGPAPNSHEASMGSGRGHTDLWVWNETPAPLSGTNDDGNLEYAFCGPPNGGHLRVVQARPRPDDYDPAKDKDAVPAHPPKLRPGGRGTWDRGGNNAWSSAMHKTETVDYGIVLAGERGLVLDDCELVMKPGDVVIQVGAWHQWTMPKGAVMAFDMIGARFVDGEAGLAQGSDTPMRATPKLPAGVRPTRRIVTIDREPGKSSLVADGPAPDVRTDPARPGYACARLWVTDSTPAKIVFETLHLPYTLEPPPRGSVCRVETFPPDDSWKGKVGAPQVQAFYRAIGSPGASTYSPLAPHPYMQKTRTLDFCLVLDGEIVLVLDTQEVVLKAGDIVVQRGAHHAWSNRSSQPAVVAIASHDGA
ncbi:MAG: cupin 2, conserved barrel domain protein [Burkholderiales bacterium]|jgi:mannose-6-phosphate isomerase-like protein (cupin superfamily)|nr:cupin 2, conserved barrel domain protein [Burkholderiales bacterium]